MKVVGYLKKAEGKPLSKETVITFPEEKILNSQVFLKEDHLDNLLGDRPNFRRVGGLYGVAQPTEKGVIEVLEYLAPTHRKIYWTNMRAEPTVFIKGESYTLRTKDAPHPQLEYQGVTREKVERFENAMKQEVLGMIRRGEPFCASREEEGGINSLVNFQPGSLEPQDVKTAEEFFRGLESRYNLDYQRIPVNDRQRPQYRQIDCLVRRFRGYDSRDAYVANCMAGMGRTTTATVILNIMNQVKRDPENNFCRIPGMADRIYRPGDGKWGKLTSFLNTNRMIEKVGDLIIGGGEGEDFQTILDAQSIGKCHIREALPVSYGRDAQKARDYLDSYLHLAFFYRYCREQAQLNFTTPFSQWMQQNQKPLKAMTVVLDRIYRAESWLKKTCMKQ